MVFVSELNTVIYRSVLSRLHLLAIDVKTQTDIECCQKRDLSEPESVSRYLCRYSRTQQAISTDHIFRAPLSSSERCPSDFKIIQIDDS